MARDDGDITRYVDGLEIFADGSIPTAQSTYADAMPRVTAASRRAATQARCSARRRAKENTRVIRGYFIHI